MPTTPSVSASSTSDLSCPACGAKPAAGDVYCTQCGSALARVVWSVSSDPSPGKGVVTLSPGGRFYLVALNEGSSPVDVRVDLSRAVGVVLVGAAVRRVEPERPHAFEVRHTESEAIEGVVELHSEDGPRRDWWERRSWRKEIRSLALAVRIREECWRIGAPTVLFAPASRRQYVRVWNDSDRERVLAVAGLPGFSVAAEGESPAGEPAPVAPGGSTEVCLQLEGRRDQVGAVTWQITTGADPVPVVVCQEPPRRPGTDAVVAIDYGTCNTRVRIRWRRGIVPGKPAGTVDVIGDTAPSAGRPAARWFPSEMVLEVSERSFRWGSDAALHIRRGQLDTGEVAVRSLKTDLREGVERYKDHRPEWTAAELLRRFLERVVHQIDEYLRTADPHRPLSRASIRLRYVCGRPVLDEREGDKRGQAYETCFLRALEQCGISPDDVDFVFEPVAAALGIARSREDLLLGLPPDAVVAVVDSGGGTTDVALARPQVDGGALSLDICAAYALRLGDDNPALAMPYFPGRDRREVGGDVLDHALAYQLLSRAQEVLEADGRAVPQSLRPPQLSQIDRKWLESFIDTCRTMKERFARVSTQYLNRLPGEPRDPSEALPFPNRPDLAGVRLVHDLYDRRVAAPILEPAVQDLASRIAEDRTKGIGVRSTEVRYVFYVGGTCVDPFVRRRYGKAFPLARAESDDDAQSDARIRERLEAVVEGAVWYGERVFAPSPLTLTVRCQGEEATLVREGGPLSPRSVATGRLFTCVLEAGQTLDAQLIASGGALSEPIAVARAFHRNETGVPEEVTLDVRACRELGATAELIAGDRRDPQWRFALLEDAS